VAPAGRLRGLHIAGALRRHPGEHLVPAPARLGLPAVPSSARSRQGV